MNRTKFGYFISKCLLFIIYGHYLRANGNVEIDLVTSELVGPGLAPHEIVLPVRYFFVKLKNIQGDIVKYDAKTRQRLDVRITCGDHYSVWSQILDRKDGTFIIRYKTLSYCPNNFKIQVFVDNEHVSGSPLIIQDPVESDACQCSQVQSVKKWIQKVGCKHSPVLAQIHDDLADFNKINFKHTLEAAIEKFNNPGAHSFCHYAVKSNEIFRKCYGQHVGFHIFPDAILQSLNRKMRLPDMQFIINLGDWPLVEKVNNKKPIPIFSWCKSHTTADILLPTYELTEATLQGMDRVSLDMMTVQANNEKTWSRKMPKLFWRGRDSRKERLQLVKLAKENQHLMNASVTNYFFFREEESIYGRSPPVSFFSFFDYKYQLNIDGTVAAYRFPFLLAGDGVVLKTFSNYQEHFYRAVEPWKHYIPVKASLEDLVEKITWAIENDERAKEIGQTGRKFATENLMPLDIFCYHAIVFSEYSKRLQDDVNTEGMEKVGQPRGTYRENCLPCPNTELRTEL